MWVNPETLATFTLHTEIRAAFPNVSFPSTMSDDDIASVGLAPVAPTTPPAHSPLTHRAAELPPALVEGVWTQAWELVELTPEEQAGAAAHLQQTITERVQRRLDDFSVTRGYDSVISTAKYRDISDDDIDLMSEGEQTLVRKFRAEARYLVAVTARTWAKLYLILAEVQAGTRPAPAGFEDIAADLPALEWPA